MICVVYFDLSPVKAENSIKTETLSTMSFNEGSSILQTCRAFSYGTFFKTNGADIMLGFLSSKAELRL